MYLSHGIEVATRGGNEGVWLADPGDSEAHGEVVWLDLGSGASERLPRPSERWRPTATATVRRGNHAGDVWVADGYGESIVYRFDDDRRWIGFDGSHSGQQFSCPHGVAIDTRGEDDVVVVADRSNRRLVFLDLDGEFIRAVADDAMTSPSSIAVRGDELIVTDLFGAILAVGMDDQVRRILGDGRRDRSEGWPNAVRESVDVRPPLVDGVLNSPHGVVIGARGEIYLTEWVLGGRQVRLEADRNSRDRGRIR
ncbi:hypothetical protein [Microbacterium lacus]|uniref:hypothetical protein n=1 Tax=Microbacterium lacus TaxID=415217 RepID=UPI0031E0BB63